MFKRCPKCGFEWISRLDFLRDPGTVQTTVQMIVMAVFGGMGKLFGPLLGALCIEIISETLSNYFLVAHTLFFGTVVILAIVFTPKGMIDLITQHKFGIAYLLQNIREHRI